MSWPFKQARALNAQQLIAERSGYRRAGLSSFVSRDDALRHSAVWACLRLRADVTSTMPVDTFRRVAGVQVEVPKPPVLIMPGGDSVSWTEWYYSSQFDLDSAGNAIGLITSRDSAGKPARIELQPIDTCTVKVHDNVVSYRIANKEYTPNEIWHEKQYTMSGLPVGLSPIAYAAMSINGYLSAQEFAQSWFSGGAVPAAHLKNTAKTLNKTQAQETKDSYTSAVRNGDVFVSGSDWEYNMLGAKASESAFLEERKFGIGDVCRFLGVPGDMIDAESSVGSITYANVTQRNLQLLIMNLGPSITRREETLSRLLLPAPRYVKLNADALLRMDLKGRYDSYAVAINSRFMAPSEVREIENRQPFTTEEEAEFARLFPSKAASPAPIGVS